MATGVVFEGKTLDDAVRKGLEALGLSRAEVSIAVMEEGSGGFLGIGARPYKVRIMPRPGGPPPEPMGEDDRGRRSSGRGRDRERGGRGGRGGREGRGERTGRPSPRAGQPAASAGREVRGESAPDGRGPRGPREDRGPREERPVREDRAPRDDRSPREDRGPREERPVREDRAPRDDRAPREERAPRGDRGPREARPSLEDRAPREDRGLDRDRGREPRPVEARTAQPSPDPRAAAPRAPLGGDDSSRFNDSEGRRRRRRGGRGRSRPGLDDSGPGESGEAHEPREAHEQREVHEPRNAPTMPAMIGVPMEADEESRWGTATATARPETPRGNILPPDQLAAEARRITEEVMRAMGFEATVTAAGDGERADVSLSVGTHDDLLTGPKGEVRQALQHLLNLMLNRGQTGRYHLQLEINDFWAKREQELEQLARRLAEEALASGNEAVTEYLNSQERRIVHVTLKEDLRVKTYALGTGLIKRVAVAPADFAGGPRDDEE